MITEQETEASNLRYVKGIGPKRAEALAKLGIRSIRDLFYLFPHRYEDRSALTPINQLEPGQSTSIHGEVLSVKLKPIRYMPILEVVVGDKSGMITAVWFNQSYLKNQFSEGQKVFLYGKVEFYKKRLQMTSPEYEFLEEEDVTTHTGRITPIYPLTEGLFQRSLRSIMKGLVDHEIARHVREFLPPDFRSEHKLPELLPSIQEMHFPTDFAALENARRRIVFDEFFIFQLLLQKKIAQIKKKYQSFALKGEAEAFSKYTAALSFELTQDQKNAIHEMSEDLASTVPMNRLIQGDVGSGKTVVAAFALYLAHLNKLQSALLVPTEILAEQHARSLSKILEKLGVSVGLLTASTPAPKRERLVAELKQGKVSALIGTHAILQEDIRFSKLAVLVTDEQHKFGVAQRNKLLQVNPRPHQLVMTATPIPRTLALTLYGDLQTSTIREMPRGRKPIKTYWITRKKQDLVLKHIREKIEKGDQAYIIFPVIEETEKKDLLSAKKEFEKLRKGALLGISMGLVHGKVAHDERDAIMRAFHLGEIKILVATSVIEVGVDNPNATMMIIENAERFGLAQLHQMRGRIGRGEKESECFLFGEPTTEEGAKRLRILTLSTNGFDIAEEDLKLRGPGDFWGSRQSGDPLFNIANPILDSRILEEACRAAHQVSKRNLISESPSWQALRAFLDENPLHY